MQLGKAQRKLKKKKKKARKCGPYIKSFTQREKKMKVEMTQVYEIKGYRMVAREKKDEHYILEIRNGVFMECRRFANS